MSDSTPGMVLYGEGELMLNGGRETTGLEVANTGDRAIQVGSHFHFFEANAALRFDRPASYGRRLDIPSGTAVRFEAGQTHQVTLVPFGGTGTVLGFNGLAEGGDVKAAIAAAIARGFISESEGSQ